MFTFVGMSAECPSIAICVTNDLATDQRVQRIASTLSRNGYKITLIGRWLPGSPKVPEGFNNIRFRLWFHRKVWFYANYNLQLFIHLLRHRYSIILANDLDTLPACFLAATIKRLPLVFDSHELFTEVPELVDRPKVRIVWEKIERWLLPHIRYGYTVCPSIAGIYKEKYKIDLRVVRNVPLRLRGPLSGTSGIDFKDDTFYILYRGAVNMGRGLELMLNVMPLLGDCIFIVAGDGDVLANLQKMVRERDLTQKVIFTGRLPGQTINGISKHVHLGVSLEEDLGLNYRYALPNKVFDYIQCRVPVLVSDLPEMRSIVAQYNVGEVVMDRNPAALAEQIRRMVSNKELRASWADHLAQAAGILCWENEEKELLEVFHNISRPHPPETGS